MITTRGEGNMKMEQRDLKLLALKTGVTQEQAKGRQHPLEAERGQACVLPRASGGSTALLAPWIQPTETISDFCSLEW